MLPGKRPFLMTGPLSRLRQLALRIPFVRPLGHRLLAVVSADRRAVAHLRVSAADQLLQPWPTTSEDRYPRLFDAVALRLRDRAAARILSFGCASGEEVRALRARMPEAAILGLDLNPRALAKARAADPSPRSEYRLASAPRPEERFDAIFAMAVFRHGALKRDRPESCAAIMPFSRFEAALCRLDAALEEGGLLAMGNAHFRLSDTGLADRYAVELRSPGQEPASALLYGQDDRRLDGVRESAVLFRKLRAAG